MSLASAFSPDYARARDRFRSSAEALGLAMEHYPLGGRGPGGEELTLDVARAGPATADRMVVVSSGLHGVEGFFGSAVQVALLEQIDAEFSSPEGVAVLLLHAINPYGFAWLRRFNEEGVDLNRNFLLPGQDYRGRPPIYRAVEGLINPRYPPGRPEFFRLRGFLATLRFGRHELKQAVAGGQYDFPKGLFFGGHAPAPAHCLLAEQLPGWIGPADRVLHIDFHTGLGTWGELKLLIDDNLGSPRALRLASWFGAEAVESTTPEGTAYHARGDIGTWCRARFADRQYDPVCAEIGTYSSAHVLTALRAENQAHHWGQPDDPVTLRAKQQLLEAFTPADLDWRETVVARGLEIVRQGLTAIAHDCG
ncbi:M14 family metallopeptidase [soil metagenome]